jgi:3-oxoacyl-[acyl-carrier-protein] synthase-3
MFGLINSSKKGKGLLLVGETRSRVYSPQDRRTAFLFGDAGVTCLIEKDKKYGTSHFDLYSDGSSGDLIKMDAGGYRMPSSTDTLKIKIRDDEGNARSDEHGYMDGSEVFNFVLQHIPKSVRVICKRTNHELSNLNPVVFHQANLFMNKHLINKLKIEDSKVLSNVSLFGNTSSVSIPLAIITEYKRSTRNSREMGLLCGFGVGMSWANGIISLTNTKIGNLLEL